MDRIAAQARGQQGVEDLLADQQSLVLAYSGHLQQARTVSRRAADTAARADKREGAALFEAQAALREGFFGNIIEARKSAASALELSRGKDVQYGAAFALALSGDSSGAQTVANELEKSFRKIHPSGRATCRSFVRFSRISSILSTCSHSARREAGIESAGRKVTN